MSALDEDKKEDIKKRNGEKKEASEEQQSNDATNATESLENKNSRRIPRSLMKRIFGVWHHIKGAFRGNKVDAFLAKLKIIIYVIVIIILIAAFELGLIEEDTKAASVAISKVVLEESADGAGSSNSESAELFKKSGSLLLMTDAEINKVAQNYFESIKKTDIDLHDALNIQYSGTVSSTVASKIQNISTNEENSESVKLDKIDESISILEGQAKLSDGKTIFEHVLMAEKYNFNSVIWRSFVKDGDKLVNEEMQFRVDTASRLKYPVADSSDQDNENHNLNFYISKIRPYLQSYHIPLDLMLGNQERGTSESGNINTAFGYAILSKAYHEIVLDRYKVETLVRETKYRVYDKTTTTSTITRSCATYEFDDASIIKAGTPCTEADYNANRCTGEPRLAYYQYSDGKLNRYNCTDEDFLTGAHNCSYGILAQDIVVKPNTKKIYCIDTVVENKQIEKDIRESISVSNDEDKIKYRWDYVVSNAKTFDSVIANNYEFIPFHKYSIDSYNNFINKSGNYANISVDQYKDLEQNNSKVDSLSHVGEDYYEMDLQENNTNQFWNSSNVVDTIPQGAKRTGKVETKQVKSSTRVEKEGQQYEDVYTWSDKLNFKETTSGKYNLDSVKDVAGEMSNSDQEYYLGISYGSGLNLVDIMGAVPNIISTYTTMPYSENVAYLKNKLDLGYITLKEDLKTLMSEHPMVGLSYGSSLGLDLNSFSVLNGLSFSNMENIAAGSMEGYNVAYPISNEELGNAFLQVGSKFGNSYGYAGHSGIDISYAYSAADKSLCSDFSDSVCPYMKGPGIYATMDGTIEEVGYSAYNTYYKVGQYVGNTYDGKMRISDTSGWGTYVKVKNIDGSSVIYSHLFPNKEFFKQMSESIGQTISAGTFLGFMGNTGSSSGLHLHIEFATSMDNLGGGRTGNSSLTYVYLKKIIDTMGISPKTS